MANRILIVEDDRDVAGLMAKRMTSAGFEVRVVTDGAHAIKEAQGFKPDVIILDWMLPAGGGQSILQRLKLSTYTNTIPVVVVSGVEGEGPQQQMTKMGVAAYLKKPYDPQALISKIKTLIPA